MGQKFIIRQPFAPELGRGGAFFIVRIMGVADGFLPVGPATLFYQQRVTPLIKGYDAIKCGARRLEHRALRDTGGKWIDGFKTGECSGVFG